MKIYGHVTLRAADGRKRLEVERTLRFTFRGIARTVPEYVLGNTRL